MGAARLLGAAAVGYMLGGIPTADLACRLATGGTVDLRTTGSRNPGAANAMRVLGWGWGYSILGADIAKGALACVAGQGVGGTNGCHLGGAAAVVGHCFPALSHSRGGKGVAASVGQCMVTFPAYFPIDLAVATLTSFGPWRRRAYGAITLSSTLWVASGVLWWRRGWSNWWGPPPSAALPLFSALSAAVILSRFAAAERDGAVGPPPGQAPGTPTGTDAGQVAG